MLRQFIFILKRNFYHFVEVEHMVAFPSKFMLVHKIGMLKSE